MYHEGEFRQLKRELLVRPQVGNVGWRFRDSLGSSPGFRVIYPGNYSKLQMEITSLRKKGRERTEDPGDTGTIKKSPSREHRDRKWCWITEHWKIKRGHSFKKESSQGYHMKQTSRRRMNSFLSANSSNATSSKKPTLITHKKALSFSDPSSTSIKAHLPSTKYEQHYLSPLISPPAGSNRGLNIWVLAKFLWGTRVLLRMLFWNYCLNPVYECVPIKLNHKSFGIYLFSHSPTAIQSNSRTHNTCKHSHFLAHISRTVKTGNFSQSRLQLNIT